MRVWDSTAERRYLVLPQQPEDTEGLDEDSRAIRDPQFDDRH
ncbi:nitrile hydratase subunit alpha [Rhizobium sp. BK251]